MEDAKKLEEEKKLAGINAGKPTTGTVIRKGIIKRKKREKYYVRSLISYILISYTCIFST